METKSKEDLIKKIQVLTDASESVFRTYVGLSAEEEGQFDAFEKRKQSLLSKINKETCKCRKKIFEILEKEFENE